MNWTKALAFLVRAVLIDHAFENGNRRTAAAVVLFEADNLGFMVDKDALGRLIITCL